LHGLASCGQRRTAALLSGSRRIHTPCCCACGAGQSGGNSKMAGTATCNSQASAQCQVADTQHFATGGTGVPALGTIMYVDSHCHLDFPELAKNLPDILSRMAQNQVSHALVVSVNLPNWPGLMELVAPHRHLYASVGVHPDYEDTPEPTVQELVDMAQSPKVVAIGETGLDYFRMAEPLEWQRDRFRTHIRASRASGLPLIIHTRSSSADTLRIMKEEGADQYGGVMHCFTESWEVAQAAMELNFYISLSGIVTFKKAQDLQELATKLPLDRLLIET